MFDARCLPHVGEFAELIDLSAARSPADFSRDANSEVALRRACSPARVTVSVSSTSARTLASLRLAGASAGASPVVACVRASLAASRLPPA